MLPRGWLALSLTSKLLKGGRPNSEVCQQPVHELGGTLQKRGRPATNLTLSPSHFRDAILHVNAILMSGLALVCGNNCWYNGTSAIVWNLSVCLSV